MGRICFPQYRKGKEGTRTFSGSILEHARKLGIEVSSECGGRGICGRCVVRIARGDSALNHRTAAEKEHDLGEDQRLACQAQVTNLDTDIEVFLKELGAYSILTEGIEIDLDLEPPVTRKGSRVVHHSGEELGTYEGRIYGLAIDVGTTTLVVQVLDLETGRLVGTRALKNPQVAFGNDVISRIGHTMNHPDGLMELQQSVIQGINAGLEALETTDGDIRNHIYDSVTVGNSTMRSVFFGQDVSTLGVLPFEPLSTSPVSARASRLGLRVNPRCMVYGPGLIGGQAGADALADILACGMWKNDRVTMLIDIGTNGEVALGNKDKIMTVSCAAGGAYEGATTRCGVGAVEGAVRNVRIRDGKASFQTIGGKPPIGICGSGLIDLLAELLDSGIMSKQAKLKKEFLLTDSITLTQADVYQLVNAKASLRLDQDLLMNYYDISLEEVDTIYLAGAFGNFINPESAVTIGLLPPAPGKIVPIGNAALAGAKQMLLSRTLRAKAEQIARSIEHVKVNEREPDFATLVAERMYF